MATLGSPAALGTFIGMGVVLAVSILVWNGPSRNSPTRRRDHRRGLARPLLHVYAGSDPRDDRRPHLSSSPAERVPGSSGSPFSSWIAVVIGSWGRITSSSVYQNRIAKANTVQIRAELERWSLKLAEERPLFGWGYGSFDRVLGAADLSAGKLRRSEVVVQHQPQHVPDDPRRIRVDRARVVRPALARDRLARARRCADDLRTRAGCCSGRSPRLSSTRLRPTRSTSGSSRSSRPFRGSSSGSCAVCQRAPHWPSPCVSSWSRTTRPPALSPVGGPQVAAARLVSGACPLRRRRHGGDARSPDSASEMSVELGERVELLDDPSDGQVVAADGTSLVSTTRAPRHRAPRRRSRACPGAGAVRHRGHRGAIASSDPDGARQHAGGHARRDARGRRHLPGVPPRPARQERRRTSRRRHRGQPRLDGQRAVPAAAVRLHPEHRRRALLRAGATAGARARSLRSAGRGRSRAGRCSLRRGLPCAPQLRRRICSSPAGRVIHPR